MRVVGFDKAKLEKLRPYCDCEIPVTLRDCVIQRNKMKGDLEIVLKTHTKIEKTTASFEISDPKTAGSFVLTLDKLSSLAEYTRVTIKATIIRVHEPQKVGERRIMKQDITIADSTATCFCLFLVLLACFTCSQACHVLSTLLLSLQSLLASFTCSFSGLLQFIFSLHS